MRHWTILAIHLDHNNKEYFLQNWGWSEEELIKKLKLTKDEIYIFKQTYFNGFEKDISSNELKLLLEYCITNMTIIGVYEIRNEYNRDQKNIINPMKDNQRHIWNSKGYKEINHCENPNISIERKSKVVNRRDYLRILNDKIQECEENLEKELKEYDIKKQNLEHELNNINDTIRNNTDKIKKQNWYLDQTKLCEQNYIEAKEKLDKIIERYNKGKQICEEQENNAKINWPNELKQLEKLIDEKRNSYQTIEKEIKILTDEKDKLASEVQYFQNVLKSYESTLDSILQKYN